MKVVWPGQYVMGSVAWVNNKHTRTTVSFVFVFFFFAACSEMLGWPLVVG